VILRVGLTGGIASGKSTVRTLLGELGCHTIDADRLVAQLYEPGQAGHAALRAAYGEEVFTAEGTIDRVKLANVAFSHPDEAKRLNALIHPIVIEATEALLDDYERTAGDIIVVVEATLMIESGGVFGYDRVMVVDLDPDVQVRRGIARGLTPEDVTRRIANQIAREERLRYADYVIDNSGDRTQLEAATRRVHDLLRRDLEHKKNSPGTFRPGAAKNL
jgi:dephospho-CoA kinase